mgnify:FL=1
MGIIYAGLIITGAYNALAAFLRALGDSKSPLYFLIISAVINVILDVVFIVVFGMGVEGCGYATVIAQGISAVCCLIYIVKRFPILHLERKDFEICWDSFGRLLKLGIPMGLQYSITAIGSVILQAAVNTLGSVYVAAMTAGSKIFTFTCCPFDALGSTMATYGGQNVGAGKTERLGKGIKAAGIIGIIYSIVAFVLLYFFASYIALLFVAASETEIIRLTHQFIVYSALFYIPLTFVNVIRFCIQGMGFSTFAILAGVFEMAARTFAAVMLVPVMGYSGACLANPLAWIAADIFLFPAFMYCKKRLERAGKTA